MNPNGAVWRDDTRSAAKNLKAGRGRPFVVEYASSQSRGRTGHRSPEGHMKCSTADCEKEAARGEKCWACCKARQRKSSKRYAPRHPTPRDMVLEACSHIADVDTLNDREWAKAWHRLRMAMRRYVLGARKRAT